MLASKIPENRGPEDVRTSPVRSWKVPGEFISLPGGSGEVVGGFGEVLVRVYEVQEVPGEGGSLGWRRISGPLMSSLKWRKGGTGGRSVDDPPGGKFKNAVGAKARWRIYIYIYIYI